MEICFMHSELWIPMYNLIYHQRLICLGLESLELGRLRFDFLLVYKIVFGLTILRSEDFFCTNVNRNLPNLRGHPYQFSHNVAGTSVRNNFFCQQNSRLLEQFTSERRCLQFFNGFKQIKQFWTTDILAPLCRVNFNQAYPIVLSWLYAFFLFF